MEAAKEALRTSVQNYVTALRQAYAALEKNFLDEEAANGYSEKAAEWDHELWDLSRKITYVEGFEEYLD
jgi:hypothetical protein